MDNYKSAGLSTVRVYCLSEDNQSLECVNTHIVSPLTALYFTTYHNGRSCKSHIIVIDSDQDIFIFHDKNITNQVMKYVNMGISPTEAYKIAIL